MIVDYGSGTYSFDPAAQQFTRITTNLATAVRGDWRVERACTERLVCGSVLLHGTDPPRPVPDIDNVFDGALSLSPDGQTLVQASYRDGGAPALEAIDPIAQEDRRIERVCDDRLACDTVMVNGDQVTVLPDLNVFGGPFVLSPDGRYTLQTVYSNTSNSGQIAQLVDLTNGARQPLEGGNSQIGSFA